MHKLILVATTLIVVGSPIMLYILHAPAQFLLLSLAPSFVWAYPKKQKLFDWIAKALAHFTSIPYNQPNLRETLFPYIAEAQVLDALDPTAGKVVVEVCLPVESIPLEAPRGSASCFACGGILAPHDFHYTLRCGDQYARSSHPLPGYKCGQCLADYMQPAIADQFASAASAALSETILAP